MPFFSSLMGGFPPPKEETVKGPDPGTTRLDPSPRLVLRGVGVELREPGVGHRRRRLQRFQLEALLRLQAPGETRCALAPERRRWVSRFLLRPENLDSARQRRDMGLGFCLKRLCDDSPLFV